MLAVVSIFTQIPLLMLFPLVFFVLIGLMYISKDENGKRIQENVEVGVCMMVMGAFVSGILFKIHYFCC